MEYKKLNKQTDEIPVEMVMSLQDVKVLYNACVDINKSFPEMIGYTKLAEKLGKHIDDVELTIFLGDLETE